MPDLPPDPVAPHGLEGYARRLRAGETTVEEAVEAYLARIRALDPALGAFEHVAGESALEAARGLDRLLASGTDLGPLMGVPLAVKDLFAVEGMPTTAGSEVEVGDLVGPEGGFVGALRRAGCVVLGKTRTVEFALGATGVNAVRGTPRNPWDAEVHRIPGGSSSGSGVAVAAGMCALATGTDTGGSIRIPAAMCGVFGHKTTAGRFPVDGVFPLSPTFDTVGLLAPTAADAALAFAALTGEEVTPRPPATLRLGRPGGYLRGDLDDGVAEAVERALARLADAGAGVVEAPLPEAREREEVFPAILPAELVASLGRRRFEERRHLMDPVVAERASAGLRTDAVQYIDALRRHRELSRIAAERLRGLDALATPATPMLPAALSDLRGREAALAAGLRVTRTAQPGNLMSLCGTSTPIPAPAEGPGAALPLPVGLQLLHPAGADAGALGVAVGLEEFWGPPPRPDLGGFL